MLWTLNYSEEHLESFSKGPELSSSRSWQRDLTKESRTGTAGRPEQVSKSARTSSATWNDSRASAASALEDWIGLSTNAVLSIPLFHCTYLFHWCSSNINLLAANLPQQWNAALCKLVNVTHHMANNFTESRDKNDADEWYSAQSRVRLILGWKREKNWFYSGFYSGGDVNCTKFSLTISIPSS